MAAAQTQICRVTARHCRTEPASSPSSDCPTPRNLLLHRQRQTLRLLNHFPGCPLRHRLSLRISFTPPLQRLVVIGLVNLPRIFRSQTGWRTRSPCRRGRSRPRLGSNLATSHQPLTITSHPPSTPARAKLQSASPAQHPTQLTKRVPAKRRILPPPCCPTRPPFTTTAMRAGSVAITSSAKLAARMRNHFACIRQKLRPFRIR